MYLTICAIFKDEAPYLREWIDFHHSQGVGHFFLYDNGSTDDWQTEVDYDYVTVIDWPVPQPSQQSAFHDSIRKIDSTWIAYIDIDEFLYSPEGKTLPEVLKDYEQYPGVAVNWLSFGNGGHVNKPEKGVLDSYTLRTEYSNEINIHVKCIVQPHRTKGPNGTAHEFLHSDGFTVNTDGKRVHGPFSKPQIFDKLILNHYLTKSLEEANIRGDKGRTDISNRKRDTFESVQDQLNVVKDTTIVEVRDGNKTSNNT